MFRLIVCIQFLISSTFAQVGESAINYLLDDRYPLIFTYDSQTFTHFGASVALSRSANITYTSRPSAWIFIGAPTGNYTGLQSGDIWRCSIGRGYDPSNNNRKTQEEICKVVNIDPLPSDKSRGKGSPDKEEHDNMRTGLSLQINHGRMVIGAPRHTRGGKSYMNGLIYFFLEETGTVKKSESYVNEDGPVIPKDYTHRLLPFFVNQPPLKNNKDQNFNFTDKNIQEQGHEWGMGQAGLSLHISSNKELLIGAPGTRMWSGAVVRYIDNPSKKEGYNFRLNRNNNSAVYSEFVVAYREEFTSSSAHWFDYFGYEVSSGNFFSETEKFYVSGAPRGSNLAGQVVIFSIPERNASLGPQDVYKRYIRSVISLSPPDEIFGSYFGSVVHVVDIDGDGRDELLVGAPFYSTQKTRVKRGVTLDDDDEYLSGDYGCVFVYSFHQNKTLKGEPVFLQSENSDSGGARFGSAISSVQWRKGNKLETYIIVGAPYEDKGHGAVYIFNSNLERIQIIKGTELSDKMFGFGSSISLSLDVDQNETPDIAIGAFKSSQMVVLRTRSIVNLEGIVRFLDPSRKDGKVSINSKKLTIESCIKVKQIVGADVNDMNIFVSFKLDKRISLKEDIIPISENSYVYMAEVSKSDIGDNICKRFKTSVNETITDSPRVRPYEVTQHIWYNVTRKNSEKVAFVLEYRINELGKVTKSLGAADFKDFKSNLPYPIERISKQFYAIVAPNDCAKSLCKTDLKFNAKWLNSSNKTPLKEITLGSFDDHLIILSLNITNANETAITPGFHIEWPNNGVVVNQVRNNTAFLLQKYCKYTSQDLKVIYNCDFPEDITKDSPAVLEIPFSFRDVYSTNRRQEFTVDFSIWPRDDSHQKKSGSSTLIIKSESGIILTGSQREDSLRDPKEYDFRVGTGKPTRKTTLYSSWKQSYRISTRGVSGVIAKINFTFPHASVGTTQTPLILTSVSSDNPYCNGPLYVVTSMLENETDSTTEDDEPNIIPSYIISEKGQNDGVTTKTKVYAYDISENALIIDCENSQFSCIQIYCDVKVPGHGSVELVFDMYMVKMELGKLIGEEVNKEIVVVSYGQATIFDGEHSAKNESQTLFRQTVASPVAIYIYVIAVLCGLLHLILIIFVLYKCGFFKRSAKKKLQLLLEEEAKKNSVLPKALVENEIMSEKRKSQMEEVDQLHEEVDGSKSKTTMKVVTHL